jgi:hypothetical protein
MEELGKKQKLWKANTQGGFKGETHKLPNIKKRQADACQLLGVFVGISNLKLEPIWSSIVCT